MGDMDKEYFRDTVQKSPPIEKHPKLRTHRNIKAARQHLHEKVKNQIGSSSPPATLAFLRLLQQTISSDLVMAVIPVNSERDAFRIFETLNDRGLRLSVPDLLLNFLMREAKPDLDRKLIRELWTEMIELMGQRDINHFLRHLWVSKYGDLKSKDLYIALKEYIQNQKISSLEFARICQEECERYVQLVSVDIHHLPTSSQYVKSLLQELSLRSVLPLLLSCYQRLPPDDFEKVCKLLLVFITRYSIIARLDNSSLENVLFELARKTREMLEEESKKQPPNINAVMAYIKDVLVKNAPNDNLIESSIPDLILDPDEALYVVSRISRHMQSRTKEIKPGDVNLEHIFPKRPKETEWGGKANHEKLEPYLWHIGNLIMLGRRINREAGNKEFNIKRQEYEQKSELEMAQQIAREYT